MTKTRLKTYDPDLVLPQHRLPVFKRIIKGEEFVIIGSENMWQYCSVCKNLKHQSEFALHSHIDRYGRKYLKNQCRPCANANDKILYNLKKIHGPSKPTYCIVCEQENNKLQLDHDHETLQFRGWLCSTCNVGIGKLKDDIRLLERAIKYLKGELKYEKDIN